MLCALTKAGIFIGLVGLASAMKEEEGPPYAFRVVEEGLRYIDTLTDDYDTPIGSMNVQFPKGFYTLQDDGKYVHTEAKQETVFRRKQDSEDSSDILKRTSIGYGTYFVRAVHVGRGLKFWGPDVDKSPKLPGQKSVCWLSESNCSFSYTYAEVEPLERASQGKLTSVFQAFKTKEAYKEAARQAEKEEADTAARHAVEIERLNELLPRIDPALVARECGLNEETVPASAWQILGNVMGKMVSLVSMIKSGDVQANRYLRTTDEASPRPNDRRRRRLLEAEHQDRLRLDREHLAQMNAQ